MATIYSNTPGAAVSGESINSTRQLFDFGNRIAEIEPIQSPFFTYLSKVAKKSTPNRIFKFLEKRHQWQRRNFNVETTLGSVAVSSPTVTNLELGVKYNVKGVETTVYVPPVFLLKGQQITVEGVMSNGPTRKVSINVTAIGTSDATAQKITGTIRAIDGDTGFATTYTGLTVVFTAEGRGQVTGSAFAEGGGAPEGWRDQLADNEGFTQIYKTVIQLFSGTSMAEEYRGDKNEYARVWAEKLMEHKMDLEHGNLFGVGGYAVENGTDPKRFQWGILPYTEMNGKNYSFTYADTDYDAFMDAMKDFFAPESGNSKQKLVLTSRNILSWLNSLNPGSFLGNTVGADQFRLDIQNIKGSFGHEVTRVRTIFGDLHFVEEPLFRGLYEDYAMAIDLKNVAYRPLIGNGISRDTFITTNIQGNDIDGRQDQILTESGLEIQLAETHALMKWS